MHAVPAISTKWLNFLFSCWVPQTGGRFAEQSYLENTPRTYGLGVVAAAAAGDVGGDKKLSLVRVQAEVVTGAVAERM